MFNIARVLRDVSDKALTTIELSNCSVNSTYDIRKIFQFLDTNSSVTSLNLSDNCMFKDIIQCLAIALSKNSSLRSLNLSGNVVNVESIADALKVNSTLTSINLSNNHIYPYKADHLVEILKINYSLTELNLNANNLDNTDRGETVKTEITRLLKANIALKLLAQTVNSMDVQASPNPPLISLDLAKKHIPDTVVSLITQSLNVSSSLTFFSLAGSSIEIKSIIQVILALPESSLTSLNLARTNIEPEGIMHLALVLPNSNLTSLDLSENNIEEDSIMQIISVLPKSLLTSLNLAKTNIGTEAIIQLALALPKSFLTSLILSGNNIYSDSVMHIATQLVNSSLTSLDLSENNVNDSGTTDIFQALTTNSLLTSLNLSRNVITSEGAKQIAAVITKSSLISLNISNNRLIDTEGATAIIQALEEMSSLTSFTMTNCAVEVEAERNLQLYLERNKEIFLRIKRLMRFFSITNNLNNEKYIQEETYLLHTLLPSLEHYCKKFLVPTYLTFIISAVYNGMGSYRKAYEKSLEKALNYLFIIKDGCRLQVICIDDATNNAVIEQNHTHTLVYNSVSTDSKWRLCRLCRYKEDSYKEIGIEQINGLAESLADKNPETIDVQELEEIITLFEGRTLKDTQFIALHALYYFGNKFLQSNNFAATWYLWSPMIEEDPYVAQLLFDYLFICPDKNNPFFYLPQEFYIIQNSQFNFPNTHSVFNSWDRYFHDKYHEDTVHVNNTNAPNPSNNLAVSIRGQQYLIYTINYYERLQQTDSNYHQEIYTYWQKQAADNKLNFLLVLLNSCAFNNDFRKRYLNKICFMLNSENGKIDNKCFSFSPSKEIKYQLPIILSENEKIPNTFYLHKNQDNQLVLDLLGEQREQLDSFCLHDLPEVVEIFGESEEQEVDDIMKNRIIEFIQLNSDIIQQKFALRKKAFLLRCLEANMFLQEKKDIYMSLSDYHCLLINGEPEQILEIFELEAFQLAFKIITNYDNPNANNLDNLIAGPGTSINDKYYRLFRKALDACSWNISAFLMIVKKFIFKKLIAKEKGILFNNMLDFYFGILGKMPIFHDVFKKQIYCAYSLIDKLARSENNQGAALLLLWNKARENNINIFITRVRHILLNYAIEHSNKNLRNNLFMLDNSNYFGKVLVQINPVIEAKSPWTSLDFSKKSIFCYDDAILIAKILKINCSLTALNLADCNIGDQGAKQIAQGLKRNDTLKKLNLAENNIGDYGAVQIASALGVNSSLTTLDLAKNKIGNKCAILITLISINSSLLSLNLLGNNIDHKHLTQINMILGGYTQRPGHFYPLHCAINFLSIALRIFPCFFVSATNFSNLKFFLLSFK